VKNLCFTLLSVITMMFGFGSLVNAQQANLTNFPAQTAKSTIDINAIQKTDQLPSINSSSAVNRVNSQPGLVNSQTTEIILSQAPFPPPVILQQSAPAPSYEPAPSNAESSINVTPIYSVPPAPTALPRNTSVGNKQSVWYFCESANNFYPQVPTCPEPWKEVTNNPSTDPITTKRK
jgi:hypothetical protein